MRCANLILTLLSGCSAHLITPRPSPPKRCGSAIDLTGHQFRFHGHFHYESSDEADINKPMIDLEFNKLPLWKNLSVDFSLQNSALGSPLRCETKFFSESLDYRRCKTTRDHSASFFFDSRELTLNIIYSWRCPTWPRPKRVVIAKPMDCVTAQWVQRPGRGFITCRTNLFKLVSNGKEL
ncbi:hypothetical protein CDD80_2897 [Ophiocordyceps camponoti-rufipedis]|uniref:AA1-like domain-containing protein n=1 Tax=Ophiocordyceps camponoti-rufipedis TaxID=2004952 RepID=A0A2C5XJI2_9HYPO|nr:hypothetical protein CDD80_2897 [Ophiocordyceps camponoti-rufipedis]